MIAMAWYLNRALTTLRAEVNARWPSRDKGSDGTIGDAAHQASASDHNPDRDGSVDAWDMDVDGVDVELIKRRFEAHPASLYWIHNRRIADRRYGWRREPYYGANPHDRHVHFNTRGTHEDSAAPWGVWPAVGTATTEGDDMTPSQAYVQHVMNYRIDAIRSNRPIISIPAFSSGGKSWPAITEPNTLAVVVSALSEGQGRSIEEITAKVTAKVEAIAAAESERDRELRTLVESALSGDQDTETVIRAIGRKLSGAEAE